MLGGAAVFTASAKKFSIGEDENAGFVDPEKNLTSKASLKHKKQSVNL